jgi:hypothetical protein
LRVGRAVPRVDLVLAELDRERGAGGRTGKGRIQVGNSNLKKRLQTINNYKLAGG